jgi:hypothetical protein
VYRLTEILLACKELIKDAKISCVDLVYKDTCLDILSKARLVLNNEDFEELSEFVNENLRDDIIPSRRRKIRVH